MSTTKSKKIVVIGGGTGTHTVLMGLKRYPEKELSLSAVVSVSDSGGSTGRLRDEFGMLPVGDVRMALAALAEEGETGNLLRKLFLYRFNKGEGLSGHNFGNLFLVALRDILGSEEEAITHASRILRVRGDVLPVALGELTLVAEYENGTVVEGEANIDIPHRTHDGTQCITSLRVTPRRRVFPASEEAILNADLLVLGPGDLYTSLLANVVVPGVPEAIQKNEGAFVYIVNLMTRYGQTHGYSARNHLEKVTEYCGRAPDIVVINSANMPQEVLDHYEQEKEYPVADDLIDNQGYSVVRANILADDIVVQASGDMLRRSLIRHDSLKLADVLYTLL